MIVNWRGTAYQTNIHSRSFVNVAVVESKGWLCHVAVDPLFACITFEHILVLLGGVFCSMYWTESVILEDALCSKFKPQEHLGPAYIVA